MSGSGAINPNLNLASTLPAAPLGHVQAPPAPPQEETIEARADGFERSPVAAGPPPKAEEPAPASISGLPTKAEAAPQSPPKMAPDAMKAALEETNADAWALGGVKVEAGPGGLLAMDPGLGLDMPVGGQWGPMLGRMMGGVPLGAGGAPLGVGGAPLGVGGAPLGAGGAPLGAGGAPLGAGGAPLGAGGAPPGLEPIMMPIFAPPNMGANLDPIGNHDMDWNIAGGDAKPAQDVDADKPKGLAEKFKFWKWGIFDRFRARHDAETRSAAQAATPFVIPHMSVEGDPAAAALMDPEATIQKSKNLGSGINASMKVTLSNGVEGVWKPTRGEDMRKLRDNCEEDHQGRREASTYIVDRWMNHYCGVPPVVYRELKGEPGTLMMWVKDAEVACASGKSDEVLGHPESGSYRRMAVLDNVIGNLDRHSGNWMIDNANNVVPIDHGLCFPTSNKRQGWHNYDFDKSVQLDDEARKALQSLRDHREEVTAELTPMLDKKAIDAMFERVDTMLDKGRTDNSWRA